MRSILKVRILDIGLAEWLMLVVLFGGLGVVLAWSGGGPQYSDELWMMDVGINGIQDTDIMNYYFHIYLQKPFMELAVRPLDGARTYWSFVVTLTSGLIYLCIRWMNGRLAIAHGLAGVILFHSIGILPGWVGATKIDITAMLMTTLTALVILLMITGKLPAAWAAFLTGTLLFLCLKSKETSLLIAILLPAFGYEDGCSFSSRRVVQMLKPLGLGAAAGMGLFMVLSWLVVGDAWWGIRPADWVEYLRVSLINRQAGWAGGMNWYTDGVAAMAPLPFLLYAVSGVRVGASRQGAWRLLWLYPIALLVFLTIAFLTHGYTVEGRLLLPALPLMCILGVQAIGAEGEKTKREGLILGGTVLACAGVIVGMVVLLSRARFQPAWDWKAHFNSIVTPLALSILLGLLFLTKQRGRGYAAATLACLLLLCLPRAIGQFETMIIKRPNQVRTETMFYPLAAFSDEIDFDEGMRMYISPTIPGEMRMLMRRKEEVRSMFNIYFNVNAKMGNFLFPAVYDPRTKAYAYTDPQESMLAMEYDQAILAMSDWERLQENPAGLEVILAAYDVTVDRYNILVFLERK